MTDSREEPEDAPPGVEGKEEKGKKGEGEIDNGTRIKRAEGGDLTRDRSESEREGWTEKDDRRKEVGLAPVYRLLSGNTYGDQRREEEEEEEKSSVQQDEKGKKIQDGGRGKKRRRRGCRKTKGTRIADRDREREREQKPDPTLDAVYTCRRLSRFLPHFLPRLL